MPGPFVISLTSWYFGGFYICPKAIKHQCKATDSYYWSSKQCWKMFAATSDSSIHYCPIIIYKSWARYQTKYFFLFKDVEKKMELKSPETPHPWETQHMPSPPIQKCGNLDTSNPNLTQPCG